MDEQRPAHPAPEYEVLEITLEEKGGLLRRAKTVLFPIGWPEPFGLVTRRWRTGPGHRDAARLRPRGRRGRRHGWIVDVEDCHRRSRGAARQSPEIDPRVPRPRAAPVLQGGHGRGVRAAFRARRVRPLRLSEPLLLRRSSVRPLRAPAGRRPAQLQQGRLWRARGTGTERICSSPDRARRARTILPSGSGPDTRRRGRSSSSPRAPTIGSRTWPPCVCPATTNG